MFCFGSSYGQLLQWNTFGNTGTETTETSIFNDANIGAVNLIVGTITPASNGNRFGGSNWFNTGNTIAGSTLTEAIAGNDYIQFIVTPNGGFSFTPTSLVFNWDRSGTGPSNVKLRSSADGYASDLGSVLGMAATISVGNTITITGLSNITAATTFRLYGYGATGTAGTGGFDTGSNSVNIQLNGFTDTVGPFSVSSGDWNAGSTWSTNSVPLTTDNVTITSGHTVYTTVSVSRTGATMVRGAFQLNSGGYATGINFNYDNAIGTLNFNGSGSYEVGNSDIFWPTVLGPVNVNILGGGLTLNSANRTVSGNFTTASGVTLNSSVLILNGTTQLNSGGFFNNSPIYGNSSTLVYNTGGVFGRGYEWSALGIGTIGTTPGYPNNLILGNNTVLDYNNGTPLSKALHGNLTIGSGSSFYMDYGGVASGGFLTVAGNVTNNGNFTLGNTTGDDLKLGGNFVNFGNFNGNNRAVFFTKNGTQTISSTSMLTIPYLVFQPVSGNTTVQLLSNLIVSAPVTGNAISFNSASDVFDINGHNLTIGTTGLANSISGLGAFKGSPSSNLTLLGTGSIGTLKFASDLNLGTFIMNRQSATTGCTMDSALTINTDLTLTNGLIALGNNHITLATTATHSGSANGFVISDPDTGTGMLKKRVDSFGAYTLHIGENNAPDGLQYAPVTLNFSSGTFSPLASYGVQVRDVIHANINAPADYISKYWVISHSGTFTSPVYSFTANYTPGIADVNGTESNSISARWNGTGWANGTAVGGGVLSIAGLTSMPSVNEISAGNRNREINIKGLTGGDNTVSNGSVTASGLNNTLFPATYIGASTTKDFEIQNLGIVTLNLTGTPIVSIGGVNPADFSVTTVPSNVITGGFSTTFIITFSPLDQGIRKAILSVDNDDSDESPYTFLMQGTGKCGIAVSSITPFSGPEGTEITLTASVANTLTGATVTFNGVAALVIPISSTQIKVIVPAGAVSGTILTTNSFGCVATNYFTVVDSMIAACQGSGTARSQLFISEITDHGSGSHSYVEIFNATGAAINLLNYSVRIHNNGAATATSTITLPAFSLAHNTSYIVAFGLSDATSNPGGVMPNLTNGAIGISDNDNIRLYDNNGTWLDLWGDTSGASFTIASRDYTYRRKNTGITVPSTTWNGNDWVEFSPVDYSDVGYYDFSTGTSPAVTLQPTYIGSCKAATLTVEGTEGYSGGNPLAYQWYVVSPNAANWSPLTNSGIYMGTDSSLLSVSNLAGLGGYQLYCQIRESGASCYSATHATKIIEVQTVIWNGVWTPNSPSLSTIAVINDDYNTLINGSFDACSLIVNAGKTLTISPNQYINIQNDLTVNATGNLIVENNGSFVQIDENGDNIGNISVNRTAMAKNLDYIYWSAPVENFAVSALPNSNRYQWNTTAVNANGTEGSWVSATGNMTKGRGYIARVSNGAVSAQPLPLTFSGEPHNGQFSFPISRGTNASSLNDNWNLVGNPFPSSINAYDFLIFNTNIEGAVRIWTHGTLPNDSEPNPFYQNFNLNYSPNDYITYNGTGTVSGPNTFLGKIASGQGFFILMDDGPADVSQSVVFKNDMRSKTFVNSNFFKTHNQSTTTENELEKHRIWLDLVGANGVSSRTLLGYVEGATLEKDRMFDAHIEPGAMYLYSLIGIKKVTIQGRPLPFDPSDLVPLGIKILAAGNYSIAISIVDGLFLEQSQNIYLEDKLLNVTHDLRQEPYNFTAAVGTFNDRFVIKYANLLAIDNFDLVNNGVIVISQDNQLTIKSKKEPITSVIVYDILGRVILNQNNVDGNEISFWNINTENQALIIKIVLESGLTIIRKTILY